MKNIFILPTDQPSRLYLEYGDGDLCLANNPLPQTSRSNNQHIYITSDEEIREGDWFLSDFNSFPLHNIKELSERKDSLGWKQEDLKNNLKIILTTDPTLITDGVQEIDNFFLETIVENPTIEHVTILNTPIGDRVVRGYKVNFNPPKEISSWQAEKMYSEDEVKELIIKALTHDDYDFCGSLVTVEKEIRNANFNIWFEEYKK
jgi:hypothetical protein